MNRRGFLKGAAGLLSLPIVGKMASSVKSPMVREGIANVAGVVQDVPIYFLKLVEKIKNLGKDVTETGALAERQNVKTYKDYTLTEDTATGRIEVQKVKVAEDMDYYGSPLSEEVYMSYSPGETIIGKNGKPIKTQPDYEEGTAYLRNDGPNTGDVLDEMSGVTDDIFKEVGEQIPEFLRKGKADGGIIDLAGGGRVNLRFGGIPKSKALQAALKALKSKFGDDVIKSGDEIESQSKSFDDFQTRNPDPNRQMTPDELEDFEMEIGPDQLEGYGFDGTIGDAQRILKEDKAYETEMYQQYKMGKLDPEAGDKSPARKRFLEQKLADMEASGDSRLMTRDEIEELSTFDLGTQMDQMKEIEINKIKQGDVNKEIKRGVAEILSDTSPAALQKSIEIDNLMLKYPGMDRPLAEQIVTEINPRKKADIIAMVEQTIEMGNKGMSGDDIIQTFKNTPRTKQASGGIIGLTSNPRSASNKAGVETLFKRR
jgi:hypothetical protein